MRALRETFKPELLDRIDECVYFPPLSPESVRLICKRQLDELAKRASENGIVLTYDDGAVDLICKSDKETGGARHLRRRIARLCERPLSEKILSGEVKKGSEVALSADAEGESIILDISI